MPQGNPANPAVRAVLKITYRCNQRCLFCRADAWRGEVPDLPAEAVVRKALEARNRGATMVVFSGGEPLLRRDLPRLARAVGALGLSFGLITNGRRLADPEVRRRLLDLGLAYVHTSLPGSTPEVHDRLVADPGSFRDVMAALEGLKDSGVERHVNTVLTRDNLDQVTAITGLLVPLGPLSHKLCLAEPRGPLPGIDWSLLPPPEAAGQAAQQAVVWAESRLAGSGIQIVVEGFPLCQIPSATHAVSGLRAHGILWISEGFEDDLYPTDAGPRVFPPICETCARRTECPGVYPGYAERYGVIGLRAFRRR
jgi:uncharacterized Fe-S cluster-containing radical SAM superfamily protein